MTKRCGTCGLTKDVTEFHRQARKFDGLQFECKACRHDRHAATYTSQRRERQNTLNRESRDRLRSAIQSLKGLPCMDCGVSYPPYVMDFDHRDGSGKVANVSRLIQNGTWEKVIEEVAKCDLVCSNCHRIRTHNRLGAVPERLMVLPAKQ